MARTLFLVCIFLIAGSVCAAYSQSMDASAAGGPVSLSVPWRFHFGDDPAWASPGFEDSHWALQPITSGWASANGGRPVAGFAWYRMRVRLPKSAQPLALGLYPGRQLDQEIFIDGALIGTFGRMRPAPEWVYTRTTYSFPIPPIFNGRSVEIAIREWVAPLMASLGDVGASRAAPAVGNAADMQLVVNNAWDGVWLELLPMGVLNVVALVVGMFSFGLFILQSESREYGWATLYLTGTAFHDVLIRVLNENGVGVYRSAEISYDLNSVLLVLWLLFTWGFLRVRIDRLFYALVTACMISPVATALVSLGPFSVATAYVSYAVMYLILMVGISVRLFALARKGNRDAQLFLVPFFLNTGMNCVLSVILAINWTGIVNLTSWTVLHRFHRFDVTWMELFNLLSYLAIGAVLVLRFTRAARQEQRLTTEMESARRVQAQLVPAALPRLQHFSFDVAYHAASEVGGDFYQVFPQGDGSALVLVGDVSGKGLKAAMLGTVIIGAAAALAQDTPRPAAMLARLNHCLAGRSDGGFATCVCALITPAGVVTLANAGHLSPYRNGREIEGASGLPLGILSDAEYFEVSLQLAPGDALTFISDGVVEARNDKGELFGFERTSQISGQPARSIADAAAQFGQQDDITVLSISYPAGALA